MKIVIFYLLLNLAILIIVFEMKHKPDINSDNQDLALLHQKYSIGINQRGPYEIRNCGTS